MNRAERRSDNYWRLHIGEIGMKPIVLADYKAKMSTGSSIHVAHNALPVAFIELPANA